jgi:hypothetical protein
MANSYLNIITFLLTTIFYYLALKPSYTYEILSDPIQETTYKTNNYMYLAIYLLLVMVIQFMVNASIIASTCGGSITENIGASGVLTFLPWTLIFGVIIVILTIYPGFKSAFSDVVGYYWVSSSANKVLSELLVDPTVQKKIDEDKTLTTEQKDDMMTAADTIIKICGNASILINQIVPSNFTSYWELLQKSLFKPKYKNDNPETIKIRDELFEIVVTRDNVGEAMWYMYTGLLLTALVQLKITTRGCASNPKTMEANYQQFKNAEQKANQQKSLATGTTYTLSS